jgi:hypothetical protein
MDEYERACFAFDEGGRRVADATMDLIGSFYPWPVRSLIPAFSRSLMDPPLLEALGYPDPGPVARWLSRAALRIRARASRPCCRRAARRRTSMTRPMSAATPTGSTSGAWAPSPPDARCGPGVSLVHPAPVLGGLISEYRRAA